MIPLIRYLVARDKAAIAERERQEAAQRRQAELAQAAKEGLAQQIESACLSAVRTFEALPALVDDASTRLDDARVHYSNGAFSPFWSAIETAYESLGAYADTLSRLQGLARDHRWNVKAYDITYGSDDTLPSFPVDLDAANATAVGQDLAKALSELVYEAQRQPTFATIWEQRRTTTVLIAGFKNLERAVQGMTMELDSRLRDLSTAVTAGAAATSRSISDAATTASLAAANQSRQLSDQSRQLSDMVGGVNKTVALLKEQRDRAIWVQ